jgi:hypothetical protein
MRCVHGSTPPDVHLLRKDPEAWVIDDVQALVDNQLPEGQRVEYKRELHLDTKTQKSEAAKDVSGFANAQGGILIYGVDEDESDEPLPTEVQPLAEPGLRTRLENVLDSVLEPVPDYRIGVVPAGDGYVMVVSVKAHGGRPVMDQGYGEYRYFRRSGTRTRPMSADEIAASHVAAVSRRRRLDARLIDLPIVASAVSGAVTTDELDRLRMHAPEPTPFHSVIVASLDGPDELIGPEWMTKHAFEEDTQGHRGGGGRTIRSGYGFRITAHGLVEHVALEGEAPEQDLVQLRVAIYRAGVVEWVRRYSRDFQIPSRSLAEDVFNALRYAGQVFTEVGYGGDVVVWVRIDNATDATLAIARDYDFDAKPARVSAVSAEAEVSVHDLREDTTGVTRRAMDRIWQGFNHPRCLLFDESGEWRTQ